MKISRIKAPLLEAEVEAIISEMKRKTTTTLDGVVLSKLVYLCYTLALKKGKLRALRICDVAQRSKIKDTLTVDDILLALPDDVKTELEDYIAYLKTKGYKLYPTSPLFPTKAKTRYSDRTLQNHLDKFFRGQSSKVTLEKIRQTGICRFHVQLEKAGLSLRESLERSAAFAGTSKKQILGILEGKIQPTGKHISWFTEYLGEIEKAAARPDNLQTFEKIRRSIKKDKNLNKEELSGLEFELDYIIKDIKDT